MSQLPIVGDILLFLLGISTWPYLCIRITVASDSLLLDKLGGQIVAFFVAWLGWVPFCGLGAVVLMVFPTAQSNQVLLKRCAALVVSFLCLAAALGFGLAALLVPAIEHLNATVILTCMMLFIGPSLVIAALVLFLWLSSGRLRLVAIAAVMIVWLAFLRDHYF